MELILNRKYLKDTYTIGSLASTEKFVMHLVDPVRNLNDFNNDGDFDDPGRKNLWPNGQCCGRYRVIFNYSSKYSEYACFLNVPGYKA